MKEYHESKGDTPSLEFFKTPHLAAEVTCDAQRILDLLAGHAGDADQHRVAIEHLADALAPPEIDALVDDRHPIAVEQRGRHGEQAQRRTNEHMTAPARC